MHLIYQIIPKAYVAQAVALDEVEVKKSNLPYLFCEGFYSSFS
jgi:hypothetical protein